MFTIKKEMAEGQSRVFHLGANCLKEPSKNRRGIALLALKWFLELISFNGRQKTLTNRHKKKPRKEKELNLPF